MTAPARPLPTKPLDRSIVDGPIARAVWMLAWPTMLQNLIGGLQGMVDHALVGHFVGYAGNAAIGVARSEEHTSELQSRFDLVCRLLLEKKKKTEIQQHSDRECINLICDRMFVS